ncbi:uncharacterized protein LOC141830147 [Curcuma longa]|uniref:uncharacterized protein LOC141830147 n=1 Tax=Curcuma longa TaxID=136217 RepID=UPI003D9F16B7
MDKHGEFKLLKIQTHILKVNIHCDGCKLQVRKILHRTEGVFSVSIDVEEQKVTVSGDVDAATLIRKLNRAGKHAEPWPAKTSKDQRIPNQQKQGKPVCNAVNDVADKIKESSKISSLRQGHKSFGNQKHKLSSSSSDEYDEDEDGDGEDDDDDDYDLRSLDGQLRQIQLMRNTNAAANYSHGINGSNGGVQVQQQFPMMANMQACQTQSPSSMVNNWIGHLQPQMMMYLRSPAMAAAYTGFYCNCYQSPYYLNDQVDDSYHCFYASGNNEDNYACSIM